MHSSSPKKSFNEFACSSGALADLPVNCPLGALWRRSALTARARWMTFKQPRPAGDSVGFQRWRNGKADSLFCSALIGNYKFCSHRVKLPIHTLNGGIKRFQVNGDVNVNPHKTLLSEPLSRGQS